MATIKIHVPDDCPAGYLSSQTYASLLKQYDHQTSQLLREGSPAPVSARIDLKQATWIAHLPLVALALIVERLNAAGVADVEIELPNSPVTSEFLRRWGFISCAQKYLYRVIESSAGPLGWTSSTKTPRVLELTPIRSLENTPDFAKASAADAAFARVLESAGFTDEYDIAALADLVVKELWVNTAEHKFIDVPGFATAHVSHPDGQTADKRNASAARWEHGLFEKLGHEGVTEIVIGDAGVGFIDSLRDAAGLVKQYRDPKLIAEWAFDAYSTRKETLRQHTRGLWAVKEKIRQLRGVLYAYSGYSDGESRGGVEVWWDFFNNPAQKEPQAADIHGNGEDIPPRGCFFQILLPHRTPTKRKAYVVCHTTTIDTAPFRAVAYPLNSPADAEEIPAAISRVASDEVLFIDMSRIKEWGDAAADGAAAAVAAAVSAALLASATHRLWLLSVPPVAYNTLSASEPLVELWREQAILAPTVAVTSRGGNVVHKFVVSDENLCSGRQAGDTARARQVLVAGINEAIQGSTVTLDFFGQTVDGKDQLTKDERNWIHDALSRNQSIVRLVSRGTVVVVEPAFDVYSLSIEAFRALLPIRLERIVREGIEEQKKREPRVWYLLPGASYCEVYVSPRFLEDDYELRSLVHDWMEQEIARTSPDHAISFSIYAEHLLPLAIRARPGVNTIYLHHYKDVHGKGGVDELKNALKPYHRAVLLVGITGSGRTLDKVARVFASTGCEGQILCVLDTMTDAEWQRWPALHELRSKGRFKALATAPVEKVAKRPTDGPKSAWPVIAIDTQTLLPLQTTSDRDKRLSDGQFWRMLAKAEALSQTRVIFRGQEIPTYIWPRKLLSDDVLRGAIRKEIDGFDPDLLILAEDAARALKPLQRSTLFDKPIIEVRDLADVGRRVSLEGRKVAALCFAASSGTGVAHLLNVLAYAKEVTIFIVINRLTPEIASAFIQRSRARIVTFQWLSINAPGSPHRFGRGEALLQLGEYRRSAQSNRLIAFIEEKHEELMRRDTIIESPDDDNDYEAAHAPSDLLFRDEDEYDLRYDSGVDAIERLLRRAERGDSDWIRHVLREAAARYESWRRQGDGYTPARLVEILERLLVAAAKNRHLEVYTVTLTTLLLERRIGNPQHMARLARQVWMRLLSLQDKAFIDGRQPESETSVAACIRALGKIDPDRLIDDLPDLLRIACHSRETELTLALELSKLVRMADREPSIRAALRALAAARAEAQHPHEWHDAAEQLFGDLGYRFADATPIPWQERLDQLALEVPDNDRTISALIQAIRTLLPGDPVQSEAQIRFYREIENERYVVWDMWPPRSPGAKPIFVSNARTIRALQTTVGTVFKRFPSVRKAAAQGDPAAKTLADALPKGVDDRSVLLVRIDTNVQERSVPVDPPLDGAGNEPLPAGPSFRGVVSVHVRWRGQSDEFSDEFVEAVLAIVRRTIQLLSRAPFSANAKMADWDYLSLASEDSDGDPPHGDRRKYILQRWVDRVRLLLGADLAHLRVLEEKQWVPFIKSGNFPPDFAFQSFVSNDRDYLTVRAVEGQKPMREFDIQKARAKPPTGWVHGMICIPLMHEPPCVAVLTLWHHARGWFHAFDESLFSSIGKVGGALNELTLLESKIFAAKDDALRDLVRQGSNELRNQTLTALGIAKKVQAGTAVPQDARELRKVLVKIGDIFNNLSVGSAINPAETRSAAL